MNKMLNAALASVSSLPKSDQEAIARDLLEHVRKLRDLRARLETGLRALDTGKGKELDIERIIGRARRRHGGA